LRRGILVVGEEDPRPAVREDVIEEVGSELVPMGRDDEQMIPAVSRVARWRRSSGRDPKRRRNPVSGTDHGRRRVGGKLTRGDGVHRKPGPSLGIEKVDVDASK